MVFKRFIGETRPFSSKDIYLGAPEAEAEATSTARMPLFDVYEDYHGLFNELSHEKFIVLGRKGCGKTAFAEYVLSLSKNDPNLFAAFIKQGDTNLEHIVQMGKELGHPVERENLFKWVILTRILKLFSENQAIQNNKEYNLLLQFLKKNSGYIDLRETEIKELIKRNGFEVNIEYFRRFFTSKLNRGFEIRSEKAPFYKLLPHLEEVIKIVLTSKEERENNNSYVIFFDDLDIGLLFSDQEKIRSLISLLRISKYINNELFGKNNIPSKAVVLLRDDIAGSISGYDADTAKIFSSYSCKINWYQYEYAKEGEENKLNIKRFINKRIAFCLDKNKREYNKNDPWVSLVEDFGGKSSSFKYVLEHTLFRPRDLILLFKPLSEFEYNIPLKRYDINNLIGKYAREFLQELKNELSYFYTNDQILMIINALQEMNEVGNCSFKVAYDAVKNNCLDVDSEELLGRLFDRSIIGNVTAEGHAYFKFRETEKDPEPYSIDKNKLIKLQNAMRVYFSPKSWA